MKRSCEIVGVTDRALPPGKWEAGGAFMAKTPAALECTADFERAYTLMERTDKNVFVTGKAGTGKSTLLSYFRDTSKKRVVVLAPTGVAALNVSGETIHSFFGFKPHVTLDKIKKVRGRKGRIYREIDAVVIDEISMVRADLLDCVDRFLRLNGPDEDLPFGGMQMIFFGDLYQLPPVVSSAEREIFTERYKSPYFFDAHAFGGLAMEFVELRKIYRQKDRHFIGILNSIRNNVAGDAELKAINERVGAEFAPGGAGYAISLTATNDMAARINEEHLAALETETHTYRASVDGDFDERQSPTESELKLKAGAQVMFLNNDAAGRWVNGTIGVVKEIAFDAAKGEDAVVVAMPDGTEEDVLPYTWEIFHFTFNKKTGAIESEEVGSFEQYPLKLAWAVTVHKSQGKTFDRVTIDVGRGMFAHGQMYVALSRCTSLEGIVLRKPVEKRHIMMDWRVVRFMTQYQYALSERDMPLEEKVDAIRRAIADGRLLELTYLKPDDTKTTRLIRPASVGDERYRERTFLGVRAFCLERNEDRIFRVDRILSLRAVDAPADAEPEAVTG
ncbi:MAG TPA: AAA family ATPase [bacterium]|nr:AAA family ATPase [bacterium]